MLQKVLCQCDQLPLFVGLCRKRVIFETEQTLQRITITLKVFRLCEVALNVVICLEGSVKHLFSELLKSDSLNTQTSCFLNEWQVNGVQCMVIFTVRWGFREQGDFEIKPLTCHYYSIYKIFKWLLKKKRRLSCLIL